MPVNSQADSLYAFFEEVDATGDYAHANILFHKQFATVFLDILKTEETIRTYRFQVEGNTCGFDALDFSPVTGSFQFAPIPATGETVISFRIPRQADDSLEITIYPENAPAIQFPLGEYIRQLGYNWKAEDLQDIFISLDLAQGLADLRVADWEEGKAFPLVEQ